MNVEVKSWKKVVLNLPTDLDEYRILFEGEYNKTSNRYSKNYVTIDNLELRSCVIEGKIRHLRNEKGTEAEMCLAIVSGIVTWRGAAIG